MYLEHNKTLKQRRIWFLLQIVPSSAVAVLCVTPNYIIALLQALAWFTQTTLFKLGFLNTSSL